MGPPCVGKTSFKSLIFNWPTPKVHHSTSLATRPVRAIERVAERNECKIWDRVTGYDLLKMLSDAICALEQQSDNVNDPALENAVTSTNFSPLSTCYFTGNSSKEIKVVITQFQLSTDPDSYTNKMVNLAEQEISEDPDKATWISFLDTGGQPKFTDVSRAFIRGYAINTICTNFKENLSDKPQFFYSINGKLLNQPSELQMTNMQLIEHFVRSLAASKSMAIVDGSQSLPLQAHFMIIDTYYDKTRFSQFLESLRKKNAQKLASLCEYCDCFIFYGSSQEVIFPVDNLCRLNCKKMSSSICLFIDLLVGRRVKVREKIIGDRKIGWNKIGVVAYYNKANELKKKIDLRQKNIQLLFTLHEFHENFVLVENSCAFKYGMFRSLICDQMSSSYFIPVVLPYCQLIDRDKPVTKKSCDPVMSVFKSNTVPQVSLSIIVINY